MKNQQGYLWLNRGLLAHRIHRRHLSERSLRNVVEQGTSIVAYRILLETYLEIGSINSVLTTVCEILEAMESNGLAVYEKLPTWIEKIIFKLIAIHGIRAIVEYV